MFTRAGLAAVVCAALAALLLAPGAAQAEPPCSPLVNEVACENTKPGSAAWRVIRAGDLSIQGYATSMSVDRGETVRFKIDSPASYSIRIFRLGYYGNLGGRLVAGPFQPTATQPQNQLSCERFAQTGLIDCGNWEESASWAVPDNAVSGVYVAHLTRVDTGGSSNITFVVRDDAGASDIVLSTSDADWQAYNNYGGNNLYSCTVSCPIVAGGVGRAYKVSYNRPFVTAQSYDLPWLMRAEFAMISFLERSGYDLSYVSSVDLHNRGEELRDHKVFISSGQDEYWSRTMRSNVEAARDAGVNLAFFSGNELFWKTRWEASTLGEAGGRPDRTMTSYKETHSNAPVDPDEEWTGTWQDPRFRAGEPQNALTGQLFMVNTGRFESSSAAMQVPAQYGKLRLWRGTEAAGLADGATLTLTQKTVGFEWDEDVDNGFRPAGQIRLSSTPVNGAEIFTDYGTDVRIAPATHNLTLHRARSGALVFGAGTVQWSWGLSDQTPEPSPPDPTMRQATLNLFADMGVQPYTVLGGLTRATKTSDTTSPRAIMSSLPAAVDDGEVVTLMGTATDGGGGVVAGVEVSTDGGLTWHPAVGTTAWSYRWIAHGDPSRIRVRATDDSANTETPGPGIPLRVRCPCSIWGSNVIPDIPDFGDPGEVELGVRFKADQSGTVSGVKFYKSAANVGPHTGSLWDSAGNRLATANFPASGSDSGWQTVAFDPPVQIVGGQTYTASYHTMVGHYAAKRDYFWRPPSPGPRGGAIIDSAPLHALRQVGSEYNGVYAPPGDASAFPTVSTKFATNYWVDVVFAPTAPGPVGKVTATGTAGDTARLTWDTPSGGSPTSYEVTPYLGGAAQAPTIFTGTPPAASAVFSGLAPGVYTFTVRAVNGGGSGAASAPSDPLTLPPLAPPPSPPADPEPDPGAGTGTGAAAGAGSPVAGSSPPPPAPPPVSGKPAATIAPTNTVQASVTSLRVRRGKEGARTLQVVVKLGETVDLGLRASRGTTAITRPRRVRLMRGERTYNVVLSRKTKAGTANVTLTFNDTAGATRTVRRTVKIPAGKP